MLDTGPPTPVPDEVLRAVDIVRSNAVEAELLPGVAVRDRDSARRVGERLLARGARAAVVAAPGGNLLVTPGGDRWVENLPVVPVDSTGAGDAFAAALAVYLAEGRPAEDGVRFAAAAAALATTRLGAQAGLPRRAEVEALLAR